MRFALVATSIFLLLLGSGCGIVPYAFTEEDALNYYHLVDSANTFAHKRLRAAQRYYYPSPISEFLKARSAPDFFYEYRAADGRKGVRLYDVRADSVYVFEEIKRNDITPSLVEVRHLTPDERNLYASLRSNPRLRQLESDSVQIRNERQTTVQQPMPVNDYISAVRQQKDSAFHLDNVAISVSYRWRTVNNRKLNNWFVPQGYRPVRQDLLNDFAMAGLISGAGVIELQFSGSALSSPITTFSMGLGFYPEVSAKGRLGLYAGLGLSYIYHSDFGIVRSVPPALQPFVANVPAEDRNLLELRQEGLTIQPEVRAFLHLGRKADNRFSLFAGAGAGFDITSRWRLTYDYLLGEGHREVLARPDIPSVSRQWLFARAGVLFKFRLKD